VRSRLYGRIATLELPAPDRKVTLKLRAALGKKGCKEDETAKHVRTPNRESQHKKLGGESKKRVGPKKHSGVRKDK